MEKVLCAGRYYPNSEDRANGLIEPQLVDVLAIDKKAKTVDFRFTAKGETFEARLKDAEYFEGVVEILN